MITETELTDGLTVRAGEERTIDPGSIHISESTPPTIGSTEVWTYTGLDIDLSVGSKDTDHLEVLSGPYLEALLEAVENLGFRRSSVDNIKTRAFGSGGFTREFEYEPRSGPSSGKLDETGLLPVRHDDRLEVVVEVDKHGGSIFGTDQSHHRITIDTTNSGTIGRQLSDLIDRQL